MSQYFFEYRPVLLYDMQHIYNTIIATFLYCASNDMRDFANIKACFLDPFNSRSQCLNEINFIKFNNLKISELMKQLYFLITSFKAVLDQQYEWNMSFRVYLRNLIDHGHQSMMTQFNPSLIENINPVIETVRQFHESSPELFSGKIPPKEACMAVFNQVKKVRSLLPQGNVMKIPQFLISDQPLQKQLSAMANEISLQVNTENYFTYLLTAGIFKKNLIEKLPVDKLNPEYAAEICFSYYYFDFLCLIEALEILGNSFTELQKNINVQFCVNPDETNPELGLMPLNDCKICPCASASPDACDRCDNAFKNFRYKYFLLLLKIIEKNINMTQLDTPQKTIKFFKNFSIRQEYQKNPNFFNTIFQPFTPIKLGECQNFSEMFDMKFFHPFLSLYSVGFKKYFLQGKMDAPVESDEELKVKPPIITKPNPTPTPTAKRNFKPYSSSSSSSSIRFFKPSSRPVINPEFLPSSTLNPPNATDVTMGSKFMPTGAPRTQYKKRKNRASLHRQRTKRMVQKYYRKKSKKYYRQKGKS